MVPPDAGKSINLEIKENLPKPPDPPKGKMRFVDTEFRSKLRNFGKQMAVISPHFDEDILPLAPLKKEKHNRYGFYWTGGGPAFEAVEWEFHCDEFRHKSGPEDFCYYFDFSAVKDNEDFVFQVSISGTNLPEL